MTHKPKVFLIGDQKRFYRSASEHMEARGLSVVDCDAFVTPARLLQTHVPEGCPVTIVFTPAELNEFALLQDDLSSGTHRLCNAVGSRIRAFMSQAQAAIKVLLRSGGGQLWVCDYDDSFGYHLDVDVCPVVAQARAAAVRSLAKEYSRMKISVNALLIHPLAEGNEAKYAEASTLRSYAMRYKPSASADVANLLIDFIGKERLAFTGATIGTGMGVQQAHLTS